MRISWLAAPEIAAARNALTEAGKGWSDHFTPSFIPPPIPSGIGLLDWDRVTEHVARAERVSEVIREVGLDAARVRFADEHHAIEAATLAAAAFEDDRLGLDEVIGVLEQPIDFYVFYAPFLELLLSLGKEHLDRSMRVYEAFVAAYAVALADEHHGVVRIGAVRDGLADVYASVGRFDDAEALFERRHEEDQNDVAVALSASRAFLSAGSISHAVRWLGVGAARAAALGRDDLATKLRAKQDTVRRRLS